MRCVFHVDGDEQTVWVEDWGVPPVAGAIINHDGQSYTVRPHPSYTASPGSPGDEQANFAVTKTTTQLPT